MADYREPSADQASYQDELVQHGLLIPSGVPGIYGRNEVFESVLVALDDLVVRSTPEQTELLRFPPMLPRHQLESTSYLKSFPHLAGSVFGFQGDEADAQTQFERASAHEEWDEFQHQTDLVLLPAACYPVYPAIARRGTLPPGGVAIDTGGAYVFRHEPAGDPARLQMFHQHEIVRIGEPEAVEEWRDAWRDRAIDLLRGLGLDAEFDVAADAFYGRMGRILAASQKEQALKFEVLVPITEPEATAVASFNYHRDYFALIHGLVLESGEPAHTACLGFGLERMTLAMFRKHGFEPDAWPGEVRDQLWPS